MQNLSSDVKEKIAELSKRLERFEENALIYGMAKDDGKQKIVDASGRIIREYIPSFMIPMGMNSKEFGGYLSKNDIAMANKIRTAYVKRNTVSEMLLGRYEEGLDEMGEHFVNILKLEQLSVKSNRMADFFDGEDNSASNELAKSCEEISEKIIELIEASESEYDRIYEQIDAYTDDDFDTIKWTIASDDESIFDEYSKYDSEELLKPILRKHIHFAVDNFDSFMNSVFSEEYRERLYNKGQSYLEHIVIDGVSAFNKYFYLTDGDYNYLLVKIKQLIVLDVLQGREIVLFNGDDNDPHIILVETSLRRNGQYEIIRPVKDYPDDRIVAAVKSKCGKMLSRGDEANNLMKGYINTLRDDYPELEYATDDDIIIGSISIPDNSSMDRKAVMRKLFALSDLSGKFLADNNIVTKYKEQIEEASLIYDKLISLDEISVSEDAAVHPVYKAIKSRRNTDYVYIDGTRAEDYVLGIYKISDSKKIDNKVLRKIIKAEIMAAITSASCHVDMIKIGMDDYGAFQVGVSEIKISLHEFDKLGLFFKNKRSSMAEELWKQDSTERKKRIKEDMNKLLNIETKNRENRNLVVKKKFASDAAKEADKVNITEGDEPVGDNKPLTLEEKRARVRARMKKKGLIAID